jgi:Na+/melibiose symporter-like transporter
VNGFSRERAILNFSPIPASRTYTIVISILLIGLVGYGIATGNPYGYVIAGVLLVFIGLPALVIFVFGRSQRHRRTPLHNGHDATLDSTMPVGPDDQRGADED